jgi:hypothetical protein
MVRFNPCLNAGDGSTIRDTESEVGVLLLPSIYVNGSVDIV